MPIQKIFIISLKNSDRRQLIKEKFDYYGIPFQFLDAVDGKVEDLSKYNIDMTTFQRFRHNKISCCSYNHSFSNSEYACALSHISIYEYMINNNIDKAIICEDDVFPKNEQFSKLISNIDAIYDKTKFDILFINYLDKLVSFFTKTIKFDNIFIKKIGCGQLDWLFNRRRTCYLTSCYVLTCEGAKKLIDKAYPVRMAADRLTGLIAYNKLNAWKVCPVITQETNAKSMIKHHYE